MNTTLSRHQMTSYQYGKLRKDKIVETITKGTAFTTPQIQTLFFNDLKPNSAWRKCREILTELINEERIKRIHNSKTQFLPAIYYHETKPKNIKHPLLINDVYCAFVKQKPSLFMLEWQWTYSIYDNMVLADAYINLYYDPDKVKRQVIMLEVECDPRKRFNKDIQYSKVNDMNWHRDLPEWVVVDKLNNKAVFPTILIVTDKEIELKETNIDFVIVSPDQIEENIYKLIWRK